MDVQPINECQRAQLLAAGVRLRAAGFDDVDAMHRLTRMELAASLANRLLDIVVESKAEMSIATAIVAVLREYQAAYEEPMSADTSDFEVYGIAALHVTGYDFEEQDRLVMGEEPWNADGDNEEPPLGPDA